jgi:hypothetical protein
MHAYGAPTLFADPTLLSCRIASGHGPLVQFACMLLLASILPPIWHAPTYKDTFLPEAALSFIDTRKARP